VIAVIADIPCTPQAANAFKSAWMPAPPPESEPAMVSTHGMLTPPRLVVDLVRIATHIDHE
jgi:hypothetical protein